MINPKSEFVNRFTQILFLTTFFVAKRKRFFAGEAQRESLRMTKRAQSGRELPPNVTKGDFII